MLSRKVKNKKVAVLCHATFYLFSEPVDGLEPPTS
ncbi:MAG: hypothetical protein PWR20_2223 [Bacteroidales bacterium]|nr:hypothetical protein [Bacteroidales bacterium]MDN5330320.1 hypothetical protein [Bacteroidales bacterium]